MEAERENGCSSDVEARLGEVVVRMNSQLRGFLRRFERDPQLLDDLVQDVCVEVLKSVRSFNGQSGLETWIFGVALNVGRQHVARMVAYRERFVEMADESFEETGSSDLVQLVSVQQRLQRVRDKLREMPLSLSSTFEAYVENGLTYEEAARSLCIPVGTVRSRLHRVRALFQES